MANPVACWVNVETGAGVKVGDGPIRHVVNWTSTALLSKSGTFSLTVAAADPRAALLTSKRVVRCYALLDGVVTEIGAGIIDSIRWDGNLYIEVTGSDLLAELRYRSVHDLSLVTETTVTPTKVFAYTNPTYTDLTAAYDGVKTFGVANRVSFDLAASDSFLFIGYSSPFNVLYTYQDAGAGGTTYNTVVSDLNYGYSDGAAGWPEFDIVSDTQIVSGVPWPASLVTVDPVATGNNQVLFQRNADWVAETVNGVSAYWIRIDPTANLDAVSVVEFELGVRSNLAADVAGIMAYAPAAWADWDDDYDGTTIFKSTTDGTYAAFSGELVLNALIKIAERAGESFRLGPDRTIHWLRTNTNNGGSFADSGVRAVRHTGNSRQDANLTVCQIVTVEETKDTNDLITRVYPYGAGNGKARVTLINSTLTMPAGYAMDTGANYIRNATAETAYGQIERIVSFKDVRSTDDLTVDAVEVCDQLAQITLNYLQHHSAINYFYRLAVTGLHEILKVGETVRVIYREVNGGKVTVNIDDDLIILAETHTFAEGSAYTVSIDVGTTDSWPMSDVEIVADTIEQGIVYESHPQPIDADMVKGTVRAASSSPISGYVSTSNANWIDLTDAGASTLHKHDHGNLDGLADDDHTQYHNNTRGDARYGQLAAENSFTSKQTFGVVSANNCLLRGGKVTINNNATATVSSAVAGAPTGDAVNGALLIWDSARIVFAIVRCIGASHGVGIELDTTTTFSATKDNASTCNVYWDSGTSEYTIQNKTGGTIVLNILYMGL